MVKKLGTAVLAALLSTAAPAFAGPVFGSSSYNPTLVLNAGGSFSGTGVAYSGGDYYAVDGGYTTSPIVQFDSMGNKLQSTSPTPGIDFRSIFSDATGALFARGHASSVIYRQVTFGTFTPVVTLVGGSIGVQAQVVLNGSGTRYVTNDNGTVSEYNLDGTFARSVVLGSSSATNSNISAFGGYLLNYSDGILSAYSEDTGALVDSTTLNGGASNPFFGPSLANGYFFTVPYPGTNFSGYNVQLTNSNGVPEPASWAMMILGMGAIGYAMRRRVRASEVKFDAKIKRIAAGEAA